MHILCHAGRHNARPSTLRNQGLFFSTCSRCERDLIRGDGRWKRVARGFRVVWKSAEERPVRNLPAVYAPALPMAATGSVPAERAPASRHWTVLAGVAAPALRLLFEYCALRLAQWQASEAARWLPQRSVLRLSGPS